ncbi:MAG: FtsQ-type POTRA domain-containing protein [Clostridia bacterium]|nr:FtsQ-type POTRA domain-containing protein [Clostridia bacterium]
MTKKKVVLLVCFLVFALLLVLNGTLFVVHNVEVVEYRGEQTDLDKQKIAEYAGISGRNIFTVSENIAIENIQKMMPNVKVEDIVREFPWTVKIVVSERIGIIAIRNVNNGYAIIDKEGVVLKNVATLDEVAPISVFEVSTPVSNSIGQKVGLESGHLARLKQVVATFEQAGESGFRGKNFCRVVENIAFDGISVKVEMKEGAIFVYDSNNDATQKLHALISFWNSNPDKRTSGVYSVSEKDESTGKYQIIEMGQA